jgi:putative ABC transport system ATP-binding protein
VFARIHLHIELNSSRGEIKLSKYIELKEVKKVYKMGEVNIKALDGVSFSIDKGEFVVVAGPSGAGKSTVLNILGGMDTPSSGEIVVDGSEVDKYNSKQLSTYRRYDIGFVFQFYNLVQNLTAIENIELATQICKEPIDPELVIEEVGLKDRRDNFPSQLSGGEQQRVSIARALAKNPKLLLCDEPTGALDYNTGKSVLKLLQDTCRNRGMTVVVITHNLAIAPMADKIIRMKNGKVDNISINSNPTPVERIEW